MHMTFDERLAQMIAALKNWQQFLAENGYPESSQLLKVAALDLEMKLHSISDAELRAFCSAVRRSRVVSNKLGQNPNKLGQHFCNATGLTLAQNVVIMELVKAARRQKTKNWR